MIENVLDVVQERFLVKEYSGEVIHMARARCPHCLERGIWARNGRVICFWCREVGVKIKDNRRDFHD